MGSAIEIKLFDTFEIKKDGVKILKSLCNMRKTKLFLAYLVLNKNRKVNHTELFELLWSGEDYSNPGTALRTLLYRYRSLIEKAGVDELMNSVISGRGYYQWNEELDVVIDVYDFEDYAYIF